MSERALALLERVERGEETVETTSLVIFETIFTLQSLYRRPRVDIRALVDRVLALQHVRLPEKELIRHALDIYVDINVSFADAFNIAAMRERGLTEVYSWDRDFDRFPGIVRIEPGAEGDTPD